MQETDFGFKQFTFEVVVENVGEVVFKEVSGDDLLENNISYSIGGKLVENCKKGYRRIVLKKGVTKDSKVISWIKSYDRKDFKRENVCIRLISPEEKTIIKTWNFKCAFIMGCRYSFVDIEKTEIEIEHLELACE